MLEEFIKVSGINVKLQLLKILASLLLGQNCVKKYNIDKFVHKTELHTERVQLCLSYFAMPYTNDTICPRSLDPFYVASHNIIYDFLDIQ